MLFPLHFLRFLLSRRQWVGLVDDTSEKDHGVQGFLQLSVVVLGPGDKQVQTLHWQQQSQCTWCYLCVAVPLTGSSKDIA